MTVAQDEILGTANGPPPLSPVGTTEASRHQLAPSPFHTPRSTPAAAATFPHSPVPTGACPSIRATALLNRKTYADGNVDRPEGGRVLPGTQSLVGNEQLLFPPGGRTKAAHAQCLHAGCERDGVKRGRV